MCTRPGDKAEDNSEAFHHTRFFLCCFVSSPHCPFHESSHPALKKTPLAFNTIRFRHFANLTDFKAYTEPDNSVLCQGHSDVYSLNILILKHFFNLKI
ncbi:MAG: hypothetical protein B6245_22270 [Desulfobacteraceae bacterium 4572_88]|nr:MAG: hypothetical protein B6245_22270 [Desulfobacteraceae bacterium 4572_88]